MQTFRHPFERGWFPVRPALPTRRLPVRPALRFAAVLALAGLGPGSGIRAAEPSAPAGPGANALQRLELPEGRKGPLDWVLGRVDPRRDDWRLERVSAIAGGVLHALDDILVEPPGDPEAARAAVRGVLAPGFRGQACRPSEERRVLAGDRREAWQGKVESAERGLEPGAWAESFLALRDGLATVAKAKTKIWRVRREDGAVRTRVLLELDGRSEAGGHAQVRTEWDLAWTEAPEGERRIARHRLLFFERARVARRAFVDVTDAVLSGCGEAREQLRAGLGHWWRSIDSAAGISIYGHQGVAVGDVDGDGLVDLYVAQPAGLPNRLLRNRGDGTFEDISKRAGVDVLDETGGPLLVDLDNDGDPDLVVPTSLEVLVFENREEGTFRAQRDSGLRATHGSRTTPLGCAAADSDRDGDLDLYVFSYVFWAGAGSKLEGSYPFPYHDAENGAPNFLFENRGGLRFRDVTEASGLDQNNRRFTLAASWSDFDEDGDADLYVANDFGRNNLYRNDGEGRFRDVAAGLGVEDIANGMSATWRDVDDDGSIDLYVGNMWSSAGNRIALQPRFGDADLRRTYQRMARGNSFFRNRGGRFEDATRRSGAAFGRWAWGCQFLDPDGDGRDDLYVTNGFISGALQDDL